MADAFGGQVGQAALLTGELQGERLALAASGAWTAARAAELETLISKASQKRAPVRRVDIDMGQIESLDTFGAWLLERLVRAWSNAGCETRVLRLADKYQGLIEEVRLVNKSPIPRPGGERLLLDRIESVGRTMVEVTRDLFGFMQMFGELAAVSLRLLMRPHTIRYTSIVHHIDLVAWQAIPIILLITFLIGAIVAQQGIFHFRKFGVEVYVVDMVGILVLREVGVLIVAIMVAGRSGSAYTAELGSMKMREEIDALRTMGFDPIEVLVFPRMVALMIGLPLLTFLGSMAALYGGGLICWLYGGMSPEIYMARLKEAISLDHFQVGLYKAPFMAMVIGIVATVEGMQVKGSAESLGLQTTASVVKSVFLVIVLDGFFAIFFAAIGK